ncbi:alginate export family protein [Marinifaba aquimaris]|uniref:alginate export family protein n=1 Tax=Marinifaba aquimaris TaxID=2741323 RepID=UPI001FE5739F|nr:alginate export family protein [Marinifaba aquimaris]
MIADPESTEVDQALLQYKGKSWTTKLGRQIIALDGQRFVGHVGWRQDSQTFDALMFEHHGNKTGQPNMLMSLNAIAFLPKKRTSMPKTTY